MGQQQSKEELLYQQVNYGNIEGIRALRAQGAGLEVRDNNLFGFPMLCKIRQCSRALFVLRYGKLMERFFLSYFSGLTRKAGRR